MLLAGKLSALHRAAGHGHDECVRVLLQNGASALQLNREGQTALFQVSNIYTCNKVLPLWCL